MCITQIYVLLKTCLKNVILALRSHNWKCCWVLKLKVLKICDLPRQRKGKAAFNWGQEFWNYKWSPDYTEELPQRKWQCGRWTRCHSTLLRSFPAHHPKASPQNLKKFPFPQLATLRFPSSLFLSMFLPLRILASKLWNEKRLSQSAGVFSAEPFVSLSLFSE